MISRLKKGNRGFTLIEIMVVIIILGILAVYIGPKIMGRPEEAKQVKAKVDISALETALKLYKLDNGVYPSTEQGLQALVEKPESGNVPNKWRDGGYLDKNKVPKDPWGNDFPDYVYSHHSGGAPAGPPTIHSFWTASATGSGQETLTWGVEPGRYWVVVMNEDASQGVDVDLQIGAKVPILKNLGDVLLTVGVLVGLVGAAVIYYGAIKR